MAFKNDKQRKAAFANMGRTTVRGSGEGRVMNKPMQVYNIRRELQIEGVDPDTVDVEAEVDRSLRYNENKDRIIQRIHRDPERFYRNRLDNEELEFEKEHALDFHEQRSELSQRLDENKSATVLITDKQITVNPHITDKWYERPGQSDISGVDDR